MCKVTKLELLHICLQTELRIPNKLHIANKQAYMN